MPHVQATIKLPVRAEVLWKQVGSFQGIGEWHPMLAKVEGQGEQPDAIRTAEAQDGQKQVERLQEINPEQHFYRYAIVSTPMPVRDYVAELRVRNDGGNASTVEWSSDFTVTSGDEHSTANMIRSFFDAGLQNLRNKYT
jgi:Polyketide cyclase / dehydrase and lipid transport